MSRAVGASVHVSCQQSEVGWVVCIGETGALAQDGSVRLTVCRGVQVRVRVMPVHMHNASGPQGHQAWVSGSAG